MTQNKSIFIKNVYYMLSYAFTTLQQKSDEDIASESFNNMYNLMSAILSKGISQQLKRGLHREYIGYTEELSSIKGKIDMNGSIQNKLTRKQVLTCQYDDLSENNLYNQILKTTAMILLKNTHVKDRFANDLKSDMLFFSNVDIIDPTSIKWTTIRFHRTNLTYRMLISLCQLILQGMLLTTDSGQYKLASFLDEDSMSRLYEKFILEYYVRHYPMLKARPTYIAWALDNGVGTLLPAMQSDVTLVQNKKVLIIDAKYYTSMTQVHYEVNKIRSAHLYQIFTYVKNKHLSLNDQNSEVSGMLLYAQTNERIQPDYTYMMSGNKISVKTLDLNKDFESISKQLDSIVQLEFENIKKVD